MQQQYKRFFPLKAFDLCVCHIPQINSPVYMETVMTRGSLLDLCKGCETRQYTFTLQVNIFCFFHTCVFSDTFTVHCTGFNANMGTHQQ